MCGNRLKSGHFGHFWPFLAKACSFFWRFVRKNPDKTPKTLSGRGPGSPKLSILADLARSARNRPKRCPLFCHFLGSLVRVQNYSRRIYFSARVNARREINPVTRIILPRERSAQPAPGRAWLLQGTSRVARRAPRSLKARHRILG